MAEAAKPPLLDKAETKKIVQKYHSDNIALDRELIVTYPNLSVAEFSSLSREGKISRVVDARIAAGDGSMPVSHTAIVVVAPPHETLQVSIAHLITQMQHDAAAWEERLSQAA